MVVNDLVQTAHGAEYTVSQFNLDFFIANPPPAFSGKKKSTSSCYFQILSCYSFDLSRITALSPGHRCVGR